MYDKNEAVFLNRFHHDDNSSIKPIRNKDG